MKKTKMLKKNYEFKKVLSKGKYYSGNYIYAYIQENNNKKCNYLGLAISSKVGKAVRRNKFKRLIRENYTLIEDNILNGLSIVFLCKKNIDIENITFENIKEDINKIIDKAKIRINKEI